MVRDRRGDEDEATEVHKRFLRCVAAMVRRDFFASACVKKLECMCEELQSIDVNGVY